MPRYLKVLNSDAAVPRVADTLAQWVNVDDLGIGQSVSLSLETPTGDVNGVNHEFVFSGPPIAVFRNGVQETRLGSVAGNTFTFDSAPQEGDDIEGLV